MRKFLQQIVFGTFFCLVNAPNAHSAAAAEMAEGFIFQNQRRAITQTPEFNQTMQLLFASVNLCTTGRSSVDQGLDALEKMPTTNLFRQDMQALLMPFAEFTRCLDKIRRVSDASRPSATDDAIPQGIYTTSKDEEAINAMVANRIEMTVAIASALFDHKHESIFGMVGGLFSSTQSSHKVTFSDTGKILSLDGRAVNEPLLETTPFYNDLNAATLKFITSILSFWDGAFFAALRSHNRIVGSKALPAPAVVDPAPSADDEYDLLNTPTQKCQKRFEPDPTQ